MKTIATLTLNPALDTSSTVPQVIAEHKLRCTPFRHEPGGGGINVSRAISRLGGNSTAIYTAGGTYGSMLGDLLQNENIAHHPIEITEMTRQSFAVRETSTNRQYRFNVPGPTLEPHEWQKALDLLDSLSPRPDYLVASGGLPPGVPADLYARIARTAKKRGVRLIVDTHSEPLQHALDAGVFLIKPNIRELQNYAGHEMRNEAEQADVARQIVQAGQSEVVVVSLGAGGALFAYDDVCQGIRTPTVPIRSKVGAGDSMVAGIVLALAQGKKLRDAIYFGVASGAAAVMTPGSELCRQEDALELYNIIKAQSPA